MRHIKVYYTCPLNDILLLLLITTTDMFSGIYFLAFAFSCFLKLDRFCKTGFSIGVKLAKRKLPPENV